MSTVRTCHRFRFRVVTRWAALTRTYALGMIFLRRKGRRPLNGNSIISLGMMIAVSPELPLCLCEYTLFFHLIFFVLLVLPVLLRLSRSTSLISMCYLFLFFSSFPFAEISSTSMNFNSIHANGQYGRSCNLF